MFSEVETKSRVLTLLLCMFIYLDKLSTGLLIEGGYITEGNILIRLTMDALGLCVSLILAGVLSTIFAIYIHYAKINGKVKTFVQFVLCLIYGLILLLHGLIILDIFNTL